MSANQKTAADQYLTFRLGKETFGLPIGCVREILEYVDETRVPKMPEHVRGVINLRGSGVPVVDLRLRLGLEPAEITVDSCIVIVEVAVGGRTHVMGALCDAVSEVMELDAASLEDAPRMGAGLDPGVIANMGKSEAGFVIMLDLKGVFGSETLGAASQAA